jgi:hypothetical protein
MCNIEWRLGDLNGGRQDKKGNSKAMKVEFSFFMINFKIW